MERTDPGVVKKPCLKVQRPDSQHQLTLHTQSGEGVGITGKHAIWNNVSNMRRFAIFLQIPISCCYSLKLFFLGFRVYKDEHTSIFWGRCVGEDYSDSNKRLGTGPSSGGWLRSSQRPSWRGRGQYPRQWGHSLRKSVREHINIVNNYIQLHQLHTVYIHTINNFWVLVLWYWPLPVWDGFSELCDYLPDEGL